MSLAIDQLKERYLSALTEFLGGKEEASGQAYELGRLAVNDGLGLLDVSTIHHEALTRLLARADTPEESARMVEEAAGFLMQSLAPFETIHRGFREANESLSTLNETLERRVEEQTRALRERSEEELRETHGLLGAITEGINDAVYVKDLHGKYVTINGAGASLFGMSVDRIIGRDDAELYEPETARRVMEADREVVDTGMTRTLEDTRTTASGEERTYLVTKGPYKDARGENLGLVGILHDITDRKQAETKLKEAEERFRSLVQNISDAITVIDANGTFRYQSPSMERVLGYEPEELIGRNVFEIIHPDDLATSREKFSTLRTESGSTRNSQIRGLHRDGSWREIESNSINLFEEPSVEGIVVNFRDITERKQAEREIRQARDAADEANRAKSEFLSRMSHELRTPMNAILGFAQLLEMEDLDKESRESTGYILKAGNHLLQLINEVLDIARIETGRLNLSMEPVDVAEIFREVVGLIRPLAADRGVRFEGSLEGWSTYVLADRQRLKQVVLNLVSNAVKYNREGGEVRLYCEEVADERARIRVGDTGAGIPRKDIERLFVPFERLGAESTDIEGTGIGLALSKQLVGLMQGKIGVDSEVGEGSTFWVELPIEESQLSRHERMEGEDEEAADETAIKNRTVLYIEDNLGNLKLIERILDRRADVDLIPAIQGRMGLDLAEEHSPDLILLDVHLPDINGDEVLKRLREREATRDIPVVVLSADATTSQIERLMEAGARAYLTKPIHVKEFLRVMDETLGEAEG